MRILFVDDEPRQARALETFIRRVRAWQVDVTGDAREATTWCARNPYEVVVMDWSVPGTTGLELCRWLRRDLPKTGRVIMTRRHGTEDVLEAFESGADDYIAMSVEPRVFIARIEAIARRSARPASERLGSAALSPRERQVLQCLTSGMANKEIASSLGFSVKNAEYHVGRMLRKARCSTRAELMARLLRQSQEAR